MEQVGPTTTIAKSPVVEQQRRCTRLGKALGERPEAITAGSGETVGHHHNRRPRTSVPVPVEPGRAGIRT